LRIIIALKKGERMKSTKWLIIITLMSMLLMSCGKKDNNNPVGPGNNLMNGTLTASISGDFTLNFQCHEAYGLQGITNASQGIQGIMQVQGTVTQGSDTYLLNIQAYHDPATSTFQLAFPPVEGVATLTKNGVANFSSSGSVTFTQVSGTKMTGTFSFTAFHMDNAGQEVTITVASGTFDVPVIYSGN
jgi:hypothetical protein